MSESGHDRAKFNPGVHHGSQEKGNKEKGDEDRCIPNNGSNGNDGNTNKRAGIGLTINGEGLDEHICNDNDDSHATGPDDFRDNNRTPAGTRNVTR